MSKYVYPAVFVPEDKGMYSISFPDIEDCITCGDNLPHAMEMAGDALSLMLYDMEEEGGEIPPATPLNDIQTEGGAFVTYILADTLEYRKRFNHKAVKKPSQYLNGSMRPQLLQALISPRYCKMP